MCVLCAVAVDFEGDLTMKRLKFALALLLLVPSILCAQQATCRRVVPVSVVDSYEVPVQGMTAENFRASIKGAPVRIHSVTWSAARRRTVVLLDLSGSMGDKADYSMRNKRQAIQTLLDDVFKSGQSKSEFALVTFAEEVKQITPLSSERGPALDWVGKITQAHPELFKGSTSLVDAIEKAVEILRPNHLGDSIYLISDGGDNASRMGAGKIEEKLGMASVRLFAFFVAEPNPYARFVEDQSERIVEMMRRTGGMAFVLRSPNPKRGGEYDLSEKGRENLLAVANSLFQQMEKFYVLEIELPRVVDKPQSWKLELIPSSNQQVKDLKLHAPTKLFPCTSTK